MAYGIFEFKFYLLKITNEYTENQEVRIRTFIV